jgi:hypothetical protein
MLERFADDAELVFDGSRAGRFEGTSAIRAAYVERPPDGEIVLVEAWETAAGASGSYAWASEPEVTAGELHLTVADGRVTRLAVTSG